MSDSPGTFREPSIQDPSSGLLNRTNPKQKLSSGDCQQSENDSDETDVCHFSLNILMWLMDDEENSADD
jgi:hypothetical protein